MKARRSRSFLLAFAVLVAPLAVCRGSSSQNADSPETEAFVLRRSDLQLVVRGDLRDPIEAKYTATLVYTQVPGHYSEAATLSKLFGGALLLSFHHSVVINKVTDADGHPLHLEHFTQTRDSERRLMILELAPPFVREQTKTVTIEYTVQPESDRFVRISKQTLVVRAAAGIAPRMSGDVATGCPRTVDVLWKTPEDRGVLAGPGGSAHLKSTPEGWLSGHLRTPPGEVGFNDLLLSTYHTVVKRGAVSVYGTVPGGTHEKYDKVARAITQVEALYRDWLGPLERPVVAIETNTNSGHGIYPGVLTFPSQVFEPQEPLAGAGEQLLAHELAHSYFGNCVLSSSPGGAVLIEGVPEYLALLVVEKLRGHDALSAVLRDWRTAAGGEPRMLVPLFLMSGNSDLPPAGYARSAYFFRMLEARIGRDALLSLLRRIWRKNKWCEYSIDQFTKRSGLKGLWEQEARPPSWSEFLDCWLGRPFSLPKISFVSGTVRRVGGSFEAKVVLDNAGGCATDIHVDFRGAQGESETRWVYVPCYYEDDTTKIENTQASLAVSLPWKPVTAALDPEIWTLEATTKTRTRELKDEDG